MNPLANARLYGILDLGYVEPSDAARIVERMIEGGVDLVQLRGKRNSIEKLVDLAAELHELTTKSSTPLIVNDYAEIASRVPVEGVHVGQHDDSIELTRRKQGVTFWSENPPTVLSKRAGPNAKGRITSDSVRFSQRRRSPITRRLDSGKFERLTNRSEFRFFASAESSSRISPRSSQRARGAW